MDILNNYHTNYSDIHSCRNTTFELAQITQDEIDTQKSIIYFINKIKHIYIVLNVGYIYSKESVNFEHEKLNIVLKYLFYQSLHS